ncbi:MAG: AAA family ATPase [Campylobacteraceae bacterium]|nr:AAA family ATPase [Campylobacteraceae bacterium]
MKFYNRIAELGLLKKADDLKNEHSVMTILIGRRRIGKTTLALQPFTKEPKLYFFVSKKEESLLCEEFLEEIKDKLALPIFGEIKTFENLFALLMQTAKSISFTLVIDEFQEFERINSSIYSVMQRIWDTNKSSTKMHLILSGSIYSLMKKIFENSHEPLFGRADFKLHLQPFRVSTLQEILKDYDTSSAKNLLDFFILTGGVAKYIELFINVKAFDRISMINEIVNPHGLFLDEGRNRLIEEFGKEYGVYFSILSLIANSKTSKGEIESILEKNISGYLYRLENDYNIIKSIKPINAKPNAKVQKYEIVDNFLYFWFRFIFKYQSLIEAGSFEKLKEIIVRDFDMFSGKFLEKLFVDQFKEQQQFTHIGAYWERGNQNEIDIVAIDELEKTMMICEVKLAKKRLDQAVLETKAKKLLADYPNYAIEWKLLSLEDV